MAHSMRDTQSFLGNIAFPPALPLPGLPASQILGLESQGNITLAVATTGLDVDPTRPARIVQGDYSAKPFATIQAAIDALPLLSRTGLTYAAPDLTATINVGAGTFPGFAVFGLNYDLTIAGTRQLATPATGPNSGTATSGGARSLTLTGAGWTVNDLRGRFVSVTAGSGAGQILPVMSNTTDTITFASYPTPAFDATSVFTIEDVATIVNTKPTGRFDYVSIAETSSVYLKDLKAVISGAVAAFGVLDSGLIFYERCVAVGTGSGYAFIAGQTLSASYGYCFAMDCAVGFQAQVCPLFQSYFCGVVNCDYPFSGFRGVGWFYVLDCSATGGVSGLYVYGVADVGIYGLLLDGCQIGVAGYGSTGECFELAINNTTVRTFTLDNCRITMGGSLVGVGNAGFGLRLDGGSNVVSLAGFTPTLTGTLGDATVDGVGAVTWAELANVGDYAIDEATGSRINRR